MMGRQHQIMTVPLSAFIIMVLYKVFGYHVAYFATIPVSWFFSTAPDMDQAVSVPKRWKTIKGILLFAVPAIFFIAVIGLIISVKLYLDEYDLEKADKIMRNMIICAVVIVFYIIAFIYTKEDGKFLLAHRGFTHTLVVPAILFLTFLFLKKQDSTPLEVLGAIVLGAANGWFCHIVEDMFCKAGAPILWPVTKAQISIGWAITSGSKRGEAHISSWIYTIIICGAALFGICALYLYM